MKNSNLLSALDLVLLPSCLVARVRGLVKKAVILRVRTQRRVLRRRPGETEPVLTLVTLVRVGIKSGARIGEIVLVQFGQNDFQPPMFATARG